MKRTSLKSVPVIALMLTPMLLLTSCTSSPQRTDSASGTASAAGLKRSTASLDPAARDEKLRGEMGERWEAIVADPKTPKFLKDSADAEAIYGGEPVSAELAQKMLDADNEVVTEPISEILNLGKSKFVSLSHEMKSKYLLATLKQAKIEIRGGRFGNNSEGDDRPAVYLQLMQKGAKKFAWGDVELQFDAKIMDRMDYLINNSWNYGQFTLYSATPALSKGRVKFFIEDYLARSDQNEVVFSTPVDLGDYLSAIYVPKGKRAGLLKEIKVAKVPLLKNWKDWESRIFEK